MFGIWHTNDIYKHGRQKSIIIILKRQIDTFKLNPSPNIILLLTTIQDPNI